MIVCIAHNYYYDCAFIICYIRYTRSSAKQNQFTDRKLVTTYLKLSSALVLPQPVTLPSARVLTHTTSIKNPQTREHQTSVHSPYVAAVSLAYLTAQWQKKIQIRYTWQKAFLFPEVTDAYAASYTSRYKKPTRKSCLYQPHLETYIPTDHEKDSI